MPADLRSVLSNRQFEMRTLTPLTDEALDLPLAWAHSSDLPDPTPWLQPGGLLLTDGAQFLPAQDVDPGGYVARLAAHGVAALGFAVGILHDAVPSRLVAACASTGMPLLELSARTPFMAVIRHVADASAADERENLERSLVAHRRVARAALRPDGLNEILRELERGLDCGVRLFDASGTVVEVPSTRGLSTDAEGGAADAAAELLARGRAASARLLAADGGAITLQTIGRENGLRGVLAVETSVAGYDAAAKDLIDSVIALASIALEQNRTLDQARRRLRSGILELLLAGVTDVAGRTVHHLWGDLPSGPVHVARLTPGTGGTAAANPLLAALEVASDAQPGAIFFAEGEDGIVAVISTDAQSTLRQLVSRRGARMGLSSAIPWPRLAEGMSEARRAAERTSDRRPVVIFDELADTGILGHLEQTRAHQVARRMLEPIAGDARLRETLAVWLSHNGAWGPAARLDRKSVV